MELLGAEMKHIQTPWIKTPHQVIRISWAVDGASGSTECEAWRGQYEIDSLERAGYVILSVGAT